MQSLPASACLPSLIARPCGDVTGHVMTAGEPTSAADEVSRRRRATYRRRFTTAMFAAAAGPAASAADGAAVSTAAEMTAWEDDELDDDDENFLRERARCRLERLQMQQKKTKKRTPRR